MGDCICFGDVIAGSKATDLPQLVDIFGVFLAIVKGQGLCGRDQRGGAAGAQHGTPVEPGARRAAAQFNLLS